MPPSEHAPPQSLDAERAVLGAALVSPANLDPALRELAPRDFYSQAHAAIFRAMLALDARRETVDLVTVTEELHNQKALERVGGAAGVQALVDLPPLGAVTAHIRIVREHAERRRFIEHARGAVERAQAGDASPAELAAELSQLETGAGARIEWLDLKGLASDGIPPIPWLVAGWLAEDDIAMIAGGAGAGKSTLAYDLADALARGRPWCGIETGSPHRVMVVDAEQGERASARLALRIAAAYDGPCDNLRVCSGQAISLADPASVRLLEREIADFCPALVVLDSVQTIFGITDENNAAEVGRAYSELFKIRDAHRPLAFLLIHHKRKSQGPYQQELLERVRGSTAHTTQASSIWFLAKNGQQTADLQQAKRRESVTRSMRIGYEADGEQGAIRLAGMGEIAKAETVTERVQDWLTGYLADRGDTKTRDIMSAAKAEGFAHQTAKTALGRLLQLGVVEKPARGIYRLKSWTKAGPNADQSYLDGIAPESVQSSGGAIL